MSIEKKNTVFRITTFIALLAGGTVSTAYAANAVAASADPSTLLLLAIGLVSLVATRRRVR